MKILNVVKELKHKNLICIYQIIDTETQIVISLEHCTSGTLYDFISENLDDRISEKVAKKMFRDLILTIDFLHSNKIAHRDVKLDNILIGHDG